PSFDPETTNLMLTARADGFLVLTGKTPLLFALFAPGEERELFRLLDTADIQLVIAHQLLGYATPFLDDLLRGEQDERTASIRMRKSPGL
ncbi:MAG: hypothetical protein JO339_33820, partial [Alphaproteobacteria bacterium]|nr:hypothetical protein [Alphaproteobacteria bacterium]